MSLFDVTTLLGGGGVGGWRDEPKAGPKIILLLGTESYILLGRVLPLQWWIQGRGPRRAGSPLISRPNWGLKDQKNLGGTTPLPPPLHVCKDLDDWASPLSQGQDLALHCVLSSFDFHCCHKTCKRLSSVTQEKHARSSNITWQAHVLIQTLNKSKRKAWQYLNFRSGIVHMFLVLGWFGLVLSKG